MERTVSTRHLGIMLYGYCCHHKLVDSSGHFPSRCLGRWASPPWRKIERWEILILNFSIKLFPAALEPFGLGQEITVKESFLDNYTIDLSPTVSNRGAAAAAAIFCFTLGRITTFGFSLMSPFFQLWSGCQVTMTPLRPILLVLNYLSRNPIWTKMSNFFVCS